MTKDQLGEVNSKQNYTNVILLTSEVLLEDISAQKKYFSNWGSGQELVNLLAVFVDSIQKPHELPRWKT